MRLTDKKMDEILSGLGSRVFVMNNVHDDQPIVFQTRWTLSYLRGPLTREQIQTLMATRKQAARQQEVPVPIPTPTVDARIAGGHSDCFCTGAGSSLANGARSPGCSA